MSAATLDELIPTADAASVSSVLARAVEYFEMLTRAANACEANFNWIDQTNAKLVYCFDTDVIVSAMPGSNDDNPLSGLGSSLEELTAHLDPATFIGPRMVRHYLEHLKSFSIPPGTAAEILARQDELRVKTSSSARSFLMSLREAAQSSLVTHRAGRGVLRRMPKLAELLRKSFAQFSENLEGVTLLQQLILKSVPFNDLLGVPESPPEEAAFEDIISHLNRVRPDYPINNYCDAMNGASVVRAFNGSFTRETRLLPLLVSNTRPVQRTMDVITPHLKCESFERPILICTFAYLQLSEALLTHSGIRSGGPVFRVAEDYAQKLRHNTASLYRRCKDLHTSLFTTIGGLDEPSADVTQRVRATLRSLLSEATVFERDWGRLLGRRDDIADLDRAGVLNDIFTEQVMITLQYGDFKQQRTAAEELREQLRSYTHPRFDLWGMLLQFSRSEGDRITISALKPSVVISSVPNDGCPLGKILPGARIRPEKTLLQPGHDFRFVCHIPDIFEGAVIALDSWQHPEPGAPQMLRIVWPHSGRAEKIWSAGVAILIELGAAIREPPTHLSYRLFGHDCWKSGILSVPEDADKYILELKEMPQYVELEAPFATFLFDISPLEETEFQAGLILSAKDLSSKTRKSIIRVISDTSKRSLPTQIHEDLLRMLIQWAWLV